MTSKAMMRRRTAVAGLTTTVALAALALGTGVPAAAATERLVLAISPPTVETNRFWAGGDWSSVGQAMGMLVGADPVTGELDNSAVDQRRFEGLDLQAQGRCRVPPRLGRGHGRGRGAQL